MSKQEDNLPCRRHEMMSRREWFGCAALSLIARSLFPSHPFPRIVVVSYSAPFSLAHSPAMPPRILLPNRHYSSSPHHRHRPRLVPLVVSLVEEHGGSMSSARVGKQAGERGDVVHVIHVVRALVPAFRLIPGVLFVSLVVSCGGA